MNKDTILQSNLLDIIFDNRNKDYGAYILRKDYNSRMRFAIFGMMGFSIIFCFFILFFHSTAGIIKSIPTFIPPDKTLSRYKPDQNEGNEKVAQSAAKQKVSSIHFPPKIEKNINKLPATPDITQPSLSINSNSAIDAPADFKGAESGSGGGLAATAIIPVLPKPEKNAVLNEADVMPEYPGGIKALLEFLKKNIHSPAGEDADDVAVKIKFVVNYNGKLEGFNVIQSGGEAFDNEVLRVLKKMPLWIPGKSNGENVSAYYIVPVKFMKQL